MALITAVTLFLVSVLAAALSRQLTDEFKAWIPRITQRLIQNAVTRLPEDQRGRFQEEWQSHVDDVPGEIGKLCVALGFLSAARRMTSMLSPSRGKHPLSEIRSRTLDLAFSASFLVFTAPLLLLVALCVWGRRPGGVFDVDVRVGKNGREFQRYSFRRDGRLGEFLETSSLCDLPAFINVLRGDMAIIGPIPDKPRSAEKISEFFPEYRERTKVKPGLVSWAAVNKANRLEDELALDLFYIENRSLKFDLLILRRTLRLLFTDVATQFD